MAPLAAALADRLRSRQVSLVGHAYASIGVPKLAALLGCSEAEAAQGEGACWLGGAAFTSLHHEPACHAWCRLAIRSRHLPARVFSHGPRP